MFRAVAHRRTGDPEIDAKCGGAVFTEEEVSTLPLDELDLFCDKLMKRRLMRVATAAGTEPRPAATELQPGREGLAPALLYVVEHDRAAEKRTTEAAGRRVDVAYLIAAQSKSALLAVAGGDAVARAMQEMRRSEVLVKSALGQTSMHGVSEAMAEIRRSEELVRAARGTDNLIKSLGQPSTLDLLSADKTRIKLCADAGFFIWDLP